MEYLTPFIIEIDHIFEYQPEHLYVTSLLRWEKDTNAASINF